MSARTRKEISIVAVCLIYSGLYFWWLSRAWDSKPPLWAGAALLAVSLIWVALLAVSLALAADAAATGLLAVGPPLLMLLVSTQPASATGAAVVLSAGLLYARWCIRDSLSERLRYRTVPTFFTAARWLLVALAAAVAGLAAPAVIDRLRTEAIAIPERFVAHLLPGRGTTVVTATTNELNRYLANLLHANPELAATIALSAAFLAAHVAIPLLVWPVLAAIALFMRAAMRYHFVYLVPYPTASERLNLEQEAEQHA